MDEYRKTSIPNKGVQFGLAVKTTCGFKVKQKRLDKIKPLRLTFL